MKIITKIKTFFREVFTEGRKVDWPARAQVVRYTSIVIAISVAVAAFLGILDFGFAKLLQLFVL